MAEEGEAKRAAEREAQRATRDAMLNYYLRNERDDEAEAAPAQFHYESPFKAKPRIAGNVPVPALAALGGAA
jgi:hypothetical protein